MPTSSTPISWRSSAADGYRRRIRPGRPDPSETHPTRLRPVTPAAASGRRQFVPEFQHRCGQRIRPVFREEQPRIFDLYDAPCARQGVLEPIRPLLVEEDVLKAPDDQGRNGKGFELGVNCRGLRVVKTQPIALERLDA